MTWLRKILLATLFLNLLALKTHAGEWDGVSPEEMGITQEEFQKVKKSGMSKEKFLKLLEVGVSPNEYFSEPWKKLGVSETYWLREKKGGMADDDINRNFHRQGANNLTPVASFFLPGYFNYRHNKPYIGLTQSLAAGLGLFLTFADRDNDSHSINPVYPIITVGAMIWSAGDAFLGTRYLDNQDARKFSFNFGVSPSGTPEALLCLRF